MKIKSIRKVGKRKVYDISVKDVEHYILENGVASHNTGIMYSSDLAVIVGKAQEKEGNELSGFTFTLNIDKSRTIKEKSRIPIIATFESGIQQFSGLAEIAVESGIVEKVRKRSYMLVFKKDDIEIEIREKETGTAKEFWTTVFKHSDLKDVIELKYKL